MGPVSMKNQNSDGYKPSAIPRALKVINGHKEGITMEQMIETNEIQIISRSFSAIGIKCACRPDEKGAEIPKAVESFLTRLAEIEHRTGNGLMIHGFGIETGDSQKEKWSVTAEVSKIDQVPAGMDAVEIPVTQYAYYQHKKGIYSIGDAYSKLHTWILENGDYGDGYMVEVSDDHFQVVGEDRVIDVYAPFRYRSE